MPCRLLVILGAGASFDCATATGGQLHQELRPPLVKQLFEARQAFTRILHEYPLAQKAAADIRPAIASGPIAIEAFLKDELRDSAFEHRRRQYWAIPLYLQHLLFEVSRWDYGSRRGYAEQPDCYDRLVNAALKVDEVTFVSLNYDDIFDQRLFLYDPLESMDSYLASAKNWSLIKLHGSINWGRRIRTFAGRVPNDDLVLSETFARLGPDMELDDEIVLRDEPGVRETRLTEGPAHDDVFLPAVSAPLGAEDDLVCPQTHIDHLKNVTGHWDPLDVLVIGYSGLDRSVLELLAWGQRPIRSLSVVSDNDGNAEATIARIREVVEILPLLGDQRAVYWSGGFTEFTDANTLENYIAGIRRVAGEQDVENERRRAGLYPTS